MKKTIISFSILLLFLFESNLNSQWIKVPSGMNSLQTKINTLISNGSNIFAGADNYGIYYSSNNGSNWNNVFYTWGTTLAFASNSSYMFEGCLDSGVYRSTNNGFFWIGTNIYGTINAVAANGNYVYAGGNGSHVYVSTDNGSDWILNYLACYDIYSIAVKGNYVFAGSQDSGIFVSTNNGLNWTTFASQLWGRTVYSLVVNGNYIFAGTGIYYQGVYSTTNNGMNWVQTSLNNQIVYSLAVSGNILFAGTKYNGVYISTDNGITWMYRGEGLNYNKYIYSLCVFNNYVFAGTDSCVFRRPLSEFTSTPSPPVLLSPPNNSVNQSLTDTLRWNASAGATSYRVQFSTDSTFNTNLIINDSTVTLTYKIVSGLNIFTKYYWRVNAKNLFGTSSYSSIWNFTTSSGVPPPPVLLSPPNNSVVLPLTDTLKWNASPSATSYTVQLSFDSTFGNPIFNDTSVTTSFEVISGLNYLVRYYWRVRAKNSFGSSGFSAIWNFSVAAPPNLIAPANHLTLYIPNPLFYWSNISIATNYEIQLSLDSTFATGVHDTVTTLDSMRILFTSSVSHDHWRVRAHNSSGYGGWSSIWEFSVNLSGIKLNSTVIPKVYKLYNNYPNPFNPTTRIEFDLPKESIVKLIIYDITGKEIEIIVNEELQAGRYVVNFKANNLSSGIYFYRLQADDFTATKKMILLK